MSAKRKIAETDLYRPIHDYLVANGYTVRSEVENCDITATRGEELIIIEMKCRFETRLLVQAAKRQKITESVYVAIPRPKGGTRTRRWRGITHLLRRLELGLIFVNLRRRKPPVEVLFHPLPYTPRKKKAARRAVLREIENRCGDFNVGGCTRRKIVTAYRENAIHIACALMKFGQREPRALRAMGTGAKTTSILYDNHYGWFERIGRGVYALKASGRKALNDYGALSRHYSDLLDKHSSPIPELPVQSAPS